MFAPENTMTSLQKTKELGATWIETDVRLNGDGQLVIFYDDDLHRLTNAEGYVALQWLTYLNSLDISAWFSGEFKGEKILTLKEFIKDRDLSIIQSSSIQFSVSTVNDSARAKLFLENRLQSIVTDSPRLLD